jgi:ATP-dependent DNA helicase RecG
MLCRKRHMTTSRLPINLDDLLSHRTVESDRIEYKAGWNPDPIVRTLCAFANDFENLGGGYVVVGLDAKDGQPVLPPTGVPDNQLDRIQRELLQYANLIQPPYFPKVSIEQYQGKKLVVLWAPGGQNRPYKAPKSVTSKQKEHRYYIRRYANTVEAKEQDLPELMSLTATVPFDDRICHRADLDDLKLPLLRSFLKEVRSGLYERSAKVPLAELGRQMNIVDGGDEYLKPRNVGVMFFNEAPEQFFPGTQIEVVLFPEGVAGRNIEEKVFKGPMHQQLRDALGYLRNMVVKEKVTKVPGRAEAERVFNYPYAAVEEALVNAVYHRSYEQREPIEVRVNPDQIEIVSYPGPDPSIKLTALTKERIVARRYRNRRIGEFLKELKLTEGRSTGIPTIREAMRQNGSPPPRFKTDRGRTYFLVELPIQPQMKPAAVGHDGGHDGGHDLNATEGRVLNAVVANPANSEGIHRSLGYTKRTRNVREAIVRLLELGLLEYTLPDKPKSKRQKYRITPNGRRAISQG